MRFSGNGGLPAKETALTTTEKDNLCSPSLLGGESRKLPFQFSLPTIRWNPGWKKTVWSDQRGLGEQQCSQHQTCMQSVLANTHTHGPHLLTLHRAHRSQDSHATRALHLHIHQGGPTGSIYHWADWGRRTVDWGWRTVPVSRSCSTLIVSLFCSRENICDGSWHHVAVFSILLCCKRTQRSSLRTCHPQGTPQSLGHTSLDGWRVDI